MTKEQFDVETNLDNLLKTTTSDRKLRLFAVACCREIQYLMKDERSIKTVDVAELFADKLATQQELKAAWDAASDAWDAASAAASAAAWDAWVAASAAAWTAWDAASDATFAAAWDASTAARDAVRKQQIKLFKDIVNPYSNPINSTILNWNGNIIQQMAQGFYNTKNFNDMPILADALEEACCTDLDILKHCRNNEQHVKGCWVVDLILGKS